MNFRNPKIYIDAQLKIVLISFAVLAFFVFMAAGNLKDIARSNIRNNLFYTQLVNYTLPLVKATTFDGEDMAENSFSIRDAITQSLGININNPMGLLAREVSFFNTIAFDVPEENSPKLGFNFNPFNLEDSMIFKQSMKDLPGKEGGEGDNSSGDDSTIPNKVVNVYDPSLKGELNSSKPQILIYHSHTSESYQPYGADNDEDTKNICAVGDELKNELEKNYGISVLHDKTVHSSPSYIKAYTRSRETVDKYMKKYGDFKLIIDMHRDSGTSKRSVTTKLNGKNAAKFMFVMTRKNPRFQSNQAVVNKMMDISNKLFPGFCRGIYYYDYGTKYFNQDVSNNAVLMEIGSQINTMDEAKESAKYLGRIIGEYINGKK